MATLRGQYPLIYLLKWVNQGVPPPENRFLTNPDHVFEVARNYQKPISRGRYPLKIGFLTNPNRNS